MFPLPHTANHSCLGVEVVARRRLSPFLAHTFVPDVVIVSCSFLTFYVDCGHSALAARDRVEIFPIAPNFIPVTSQYSSLAL